MLHFPTISPPGSPSSTARQPTNRRANPTGGADKREAVAVDRRRLRDRRTRRGARQIMDRRSGTDRRRASIDLSI